MPVCSCGMTHSCLWCTNPHIFSPCQLSIQNLHHCRGFTSTWNRCGGLETSAPPPWGFLPPCSTFPLPSCACDYQSPRFSFALGGQPFSISSNVPRKSVSRATGVPNTLPAAPGWCLLCLHFFFSFIYFCKNVGWFEQTWIKRCKNTVKDGVGVDLMLSSPEAINQHLVGISSLKYHGSKWSHHLHTKSGKSITP